MSSTEPARAGWVGTASAYGASLVIIEVVCPDPAEHRRRVERRENDLPGFTLPTWRQVEEIMREYEDRSDERLVVDSTRPLADTLDDALAFIHIQQRRDLEIHAG